MVRFFESAPILSWKTWLQRRVFPVNITKPKLLPLHTNPNPYCKSPTGVPYSKCTLENSYEYVLFLEQYFYSNASSDSEIESIRLKIPAEHLKTEFQSESLLGIEVRTPKKELVGVVFSRKVGYYDGNLCRLITWFCIVPQWRKKGLADYMLFGIREASYPTTLFLFRNDGLAKSITPPVWTETKCMRIKHNTKMSTGFRRASHEELIKPYTQFWKKKNPTGLFFELKSVLPTLEWYIYTTTHMNIFYTYAVLISNLFEYRRSDSACEIIDWFPLSKKASDDIEPFILEQIVSHLPYTYVEAPERMPRFLEYSWKPCAPMSWHVYGLDVGNPVLRPIYTVSIA